MTTTETVPDIKVDESKLDDDLDHNYCTCSPEVALCGAPLDGIDNGDSDTTPDYNTCVVCADLCEQPCERCGW